MEKYYYINGKKTSKELFDCYLIKVSKFIALCENDNFRDIYNDLFVQLDSEGVILNIQKIEFQIKRYKKRLKK